ncbi:unnamed protein product, partial [marine sediment metagenome]
CWNSPFPDAYFNGLSQNIPYNEFSFFTYQAAIEAELARPPKVSRVYQPVYTP